MNSASSGPLKADQSEKVYALLCDLLRVTDDAISGNITFLNFSLGESAALAGASFSLGQVAEVTRTVLGVNILEPNLYFQTDEGDFTVIFVETEENEAGRICRTCREQVIEILSSKDGVDVPEIEVGVREITYEQLTANPKSLLPALTAEAVERARRSQERRPQRKLSVKLGFRPVWNSAKNVVGTFMVGLSRQLPNGETHHGYSTLPNRKDMSDIGAFDRSMLNLSVRSLEQGVRNGQNYVLVTPINYASLVDRVQEPVYQATLRQVPAELKRRLCLQLIGAYPEAPLWRLRTIIDNLSGFCRSVVLQLPLDPEACRVVKDARIGAIGTSAFHDPATEKDIEERLAAFAEAAKKLKVPLYLTSVNDARLALVAQRLGYEFLAGDFVGPQNYTPFDIRFSTYEELSAAQQERAA